MTELHDLLERATDLVESPDFAATALATARRRRRQYRRMLAAGVAAVVVLVIALAGQLNQRDAESVQPVTPSPSPSPSSSVLPDVTQPQWDPRKIDELPVSEAGNLPEVIDPPQTAASLADDPIDGARLSMTGDNCILLLATDGTWRSAGLPDDDAFGAKLSADGTKLAVNSRTGADI